MKKKKDKKTFLYTVTFTVETSRKLKPSDLEEKVAEVWDNGIGASDQKLIVDSYLFSAAES